uniref:B8 n=1 Tax=Polytomella sp. Pringsheim 198.80 TaxID=37502 RepID=UPI001E1E23EC|nr:Chain S, B8 [Polytomella sp. Pringsheim 198.80]7ARD_S Chain S, B8 [Polytomella sp. Pringsheim 198.80]|mmetsp:Transcript_19278/g.34844  ORF Transcript_19278/g.34844 Transcript_19278/m.34844 type:complete len:99 (+) Transcript_19278:56-352(+)|eukprot:CAMPEP_0175045392 /NCGR_PEP_ID=MMETSP0052_2-20121109/4393_1 /TAXON_ID=51329 ORGANISM="Polytomella parva, Strain SAG 63-3" /NCGR_SAMPLE_ID=MMETSP0052_2 /ASSEMBLY_ACC=CAM_ASM_000194 /LENGTH=98 /DNA_ID=CAMNT_0016308909 /DNA_START=54 /DNA_END=350 /DNA_ORIENTATION=-
MAWKTALTTTFQELRITLSQSSSSSAGAREFVLGQYAELKAANPLLPILVRESNAAQASLTARYDFGVEKKVSIENDSASGILSKLEGLVKHGQSLAK